MGDGDGFDPRTLDATTIAVPLLQELARTVADDLVAVIVELNLQHADGARAAHEQLVALVEQVADDAEGQVHPRSRASDRYVFAELRPASVRELVALDLARGGGHHGRLVHKVWPDFALRAHVIDSVATVKADAAMIAFSALGEGIVWAVADSGIDGGNRHFALHRNLEHAGLEHQDFTGGDAPLEDDFGHGTHVAGILAGEYTTLDDARRRQAVVVRRTRDEQGGADWWTAAVDRVTGVAPRCGLVSLKVLDGTGAGRSSNLVAALEHVQQVNSHGRFLRIHGVNLSVGYPFDPEWFACGQSPLCIEVDRLVRSGVVVVVAAGNTGYGHLSSHALGAVSAGMDLTINDPGNAELAITVGATHRDKPHQYGVSYFSSKGPTGDGRPKPDLVAPGERIVSAAAGTMQRDAHAAVGTHVDYVEDSGTSMAAPHVSGAVAAFLSVRREFVGHPLRIKELFCASATDLRRAPAFQGHGLLDLMRTIQSV